MPSAQNEAFSRILIDKALEFSGWDLLNPRQVRFELSGHGGRADYVLSGERGPLAVLEAKKDSFDPYKPRNGHATTSNLYLGQVSNEENLSERLRAHTKVKRAISSERNSTDITHEHDTLVFPGLPLVEV
jgi:type I site-specific restriction endonuclease